MALAASAFGQSAVTDPVGLIEVTVPAANGSTPSNLPASIPLSNPGIFTSTISSIDAADSFSMTQANWLPSVLTTSPHFVRVKDGANVGRFYLVVSHTSAQLTVDANTDLSTVLAVGDKCEIVPANTLGSVFGTTTPLLLPGANANVADNIQLWDGAIWETFFHDGTSWQKSGATGSQDNTIIYPDDGLYIVRRGGTPLGFTFGGTIPTTTERTDLNGAGSSFIGNRFPVNMRLVDIGLHLTPNWVSGNKNQADKVYLWNGTDYSTYFHNGNAWRRVGSSGNQNNTIVPLGAAIYITKSGAADVTLVQALPYPL